MRLSKEIRAVVAGLATAALVMSLSGCAGNDNSASLGAKAGDWLVNGDAFYDPIGSAGAIEELCQRNYEIDAAKVSNKNLYLASCKNAFFQAQSQAESGNQGYSGDNSTNYPTGSQLPDPGYPTSDSQPTPAKFTYWNPTAQNIINCSKNEADPCETLPQKENTFGINALKIAQNLINSGICSGLVTNGLSFTNGRSEAECSIPYQDESCETYIVANDGIIFQAVKPPRSWYGFGQVVVKDGLIVELTCSDYYGIDEQKTAEQNYLSQIANLLGGQVASLGS